MSEPQTSACTTERLLPDKRLAPVFKLLAIVTDSAMGESLNDKLKAAFAAAWEVSYVLKDAERIKAGVHKDDAALFEDLRVRVGLMWKRLIVDAGYAPVKDETSHAMAAVDLTVEIAIRRIEELSGLLRIEREAANARKEPF